MRKKCSVTTKRNQAARFFVSLDAAVHRHPHEGDLIPAIVYQLLSLLDERMLIARASSTLTGFATVSSEAERG